MKTGIKIDFTAEGGVIDFGQRVTGFSAQGQNALVNVGTRLGSDVVVPQKGTTLEERAMLRNSFDPVWAINTANFAALRTRSFMVRSDRDAETLSTIVDRLQLRPSTYANQRFTVLVEMSNDNGDTFGDVGIGLRLSDLTES